MASVPLLCILSLLSSRVLGYLPGEDLTNSIIGPFPPDLTVIPSGIESSQEEVIDEQVPEDSIYKKKPLTFRRRNINGPTGGRIPFSRMSYKSGYGSNRFTSRPMTQTIRDRNPYGTVTIGAPYEGRPNDPYNLRPRPPYSGLIGGSRNAFVGSMMNSQRGRPGKHENELINSFGRSAPTQQELATYASRYGPSYIRGGSFPPWDTKNGAINRIPSDYSKNIATNLWNLPIENTNRESVFDSYLHDTNDTKKELSKKNKD